MSNNPVVVPITTFAPEPYELVRDIPVVVTPCGDCFTASFMDANIGASGDTQQEAFDNLRELLLDLYDSLANTPDEELGPGPWRQKCVLAQFVIRTVPQPLPQPLPFIRKPTRF